MPRSPGARLLPAPPATQSGAGREMNHRKGVIEMNNKDAWTIYEKYLQGWNSESVAVRKNVAAEITTVDIKYRTRLHESGGRPEIIQDMMSFKEKFPGGHFEIGDVASHHDVALLTWVIVQGDGKVFVQGHDQIR